MIVLLALLGGVALLAPQYFQPPPPPAAIAASGGRPLQINLGHDAVYFLQTDARWKESRLGGGREKIASVGCTLCSVAMALEELGIHTTPGELNQELTAHAGFTEQALMVWSKISEVTTGQAEAVVCPAPSHAEMDECLTKGAYPVIKIVLPRGISHWVIVVGKDGLDYLIKDPLLPDKQVVKLSTRTGAIEAVRFIRRSPAAN